MVWENTGRYRPGLILWLFIILIHYTYSAPVYDEDTTQVAEYESKLPFMSYLGFRCYYNFQYYDEGERIITNEPCLNCTCHNRMLMCYLRVCPFTKAIGQDCKVEKRPDQCCPAITCPEVPVHLLTSTTSAPTSEIDQQTSTELG
ncbi:GSCOCG00009988001-RA-CDS, partial [Cotesia congregata]